MSVNLISHLNSSKSNVLFPVYEPVSAPMSKMTSADVKEVPAETSMTSSSAAAAGAPRLHGRSATDPCDSNSPQSHRKFANPAPLGLSSFAATTFLLSLFNIQSRGITTPNLIVALAMGYGGLVQLLAGMWEFAAGNTFGATAFSSYGGFWISFGLIFWPQSGILTAYAGEGAQLENALGLYLFTWFIFTSILLIASLRSSLALVSLFFILDVTFLLLALGKFYPDLTSITKTGGVLGLITAFIAWYIAAADLLTPDTSFFTLPLVDLSPARKRRD